MSVTILTTDTTTNYIFNFPLQVRGAFIYGIKTLTLGTNYTFNYIFNTATLNIDINKHKTFTIPYLLNEYQFKNYFSTGVNKTYRIPFIFNIKDTKLYKLNFNFKTFSCNSEFISLVPIQTQTYSLKYDIFKRIFSSKDYTSFKYTTNIKIKSLNFKLFKKVFLTKDKSMFTYNTKFKSAIAGSEFLYSKKFYITYNPFFINKNNFITFIYSPKKRIVLEDKWIS